MVFAVSVFVLKKYCKKRRQVTNLNDSVNSLARAVEVIKNKTKNEFQRQLHSKIYFP